MVTAEERANQLFTTNRSEVPETAIKYAEHLCRKLAGCSEVIIEAYRAYAEIIEGRQTETPSDEETRLWFREHLFRKACFESMARHIADETPLTDELFQEGGWTQSINGFGRLIHGEGDFIELFFLESDEAGVYHASMMQSSPPDSIAITGRDFRTRGDVYLLLAALGG